MLPCYDELHKTETERFLAMRKNTNSMVHTIIVRGSMVLFLMALIVVVGTRTTSIGIAKEHAQTMKDVHRWQVDSSLITLSQGHLESSKTAYQDILFEEFIEVDNPNNDDITITATFAPSETWLRLDDNGDGSAMLSGVPRHKDIGTHQVTLIAIKDTSQTEIGRFSMDIEVQAANDAPIFTSDPPLEATVGETYTYNVQAEDPDPGDTITITPTIKPNWLTWTTSGDGNGVLEGTPTVDDLGIHAAQLVVADTQGYESIFDFDINVQSVVRDGTTCRETEPNNSIENAVTFAFDSDNQAVCEGTISTDTDADWYGMVLKPNTTIQISLKNLAAAYNVALVSNPSSEMDNTDGNDLRGIGDYGNINKNGQTRNHGNTTNVSRINNMGGKDVTDNIIAQSDGTGTNDRFLEVELAESGAYYILVYSENGKFSTDMPYELHVSFTGGDDIRCFATAKKINQLNITENETITSLFLYNSQRMRETYPEQGKSINLLVEYLKSDSQLMKDTNGIAIDLNSNVFLQQDANTLNMLYDQWDETPSDPLLANEVAQQMKNVIDIATTSYFSNVKDIVLIGSDDIIPFYRVRDETEIGNEGEYADELLQTGLLSGTSALAGSLQESYILTDNFFADRVPTSWRGRYLYMPDFGIGRLVETPKQIISYIRSFLPQITATDPYNPITPGSYVIDAANTTPEKTGAVFVSGYDFLRDQAAALSELFAVFGFSANGTLGTSHTLTQLNNDAWSIDDFVNTLFSNQLDQLTDSYNGPYSRHHIMSLNSHFSHYMFEDSQGDPFQAVSLLEPTVDSKQPDGAYFNHKGNATLLYSSGCHAGLNVPDNVVTDSTSRLRADFASAVLKQGGTWVGSTSYSYGDSNVVGYAEKLSLLFTQAIGTNADEGGVYTGAPLGQSLARAKWDYLHSTGPGGFSIYDEKVLIGMTLYGFPFIRVKVPQPTDQPSTVRLTIPDTVSESGIITRLVTISSSFTLNDANQIQTISTLEDSFRPGETITVEPEQQMAPGRAVLPVFNYDVSFPTDMQWGTNVPEVRGVQLLAAETDVVMNYTPDVTHLITEQIYHDDIPDMLVQDEWMPEESYTNQQTSVSIEIIKSPGCGACLQSNGSNQSSASLLSSNDYLTFNLAQFRADGTDDGTLRLFKKLVFEVTYLDPTVQPPDAKNCRNCDASFVSMDIDQSDADVWKINAKVTATQSKGVDTVSAVYTLDQELWDRVILTSSDGENYSATVPVPESGREFFAFVEILDKSGNVTVEAIDAAAPFVVPNVEKVFVPIVMN